MNLNEGVGQIMRDYPTVFFACHTQHKIDALTQVKLTSNQLRIIDHLDGKKPMTLYELSLHLGVPPF